MNLKRVRIRLPIIFSVLSLVFCFNLAMLSGIMIRLIRITLILLDVFVVIHQAGIHQKIRNPEIWTYTIVIIMSGYINSGIGHSLQQALLYAGMLLMSYLITRCAIEIYGEEELLKVLSNFLCVIMTVIDIMIIFNNGVGTHLTGRSDLFYYIGSKFTVSYFNMFLFALIIWKSKKKQKLLIIGLASVFIYISFLIDCMTGVTGILVMVIMCLTKDKIEDVVRKPWIVTFSVLLSGAFAMAMQSVVNLQPVRWFLTFVVRTDLEMTGRAGIFAILGKLFLKKPVLGYGYGNTAVKDFLGYGNPQNGLLDIGISYGIVGILAFLLLVFKATATRKYKNNEEKNMYPILVFIYAMIVCGTVEINFSILMIFALALYKKREDKI